MADAVAVTDSTFESEVLNSPTPVLVDFWAEWCQPCRMLAPHLEKVATEQGEKLKVVKLNVDENPKMMQQFQIRGIPTLMLFKEGKQVGQKVGAAPKGDLSRWIQQATA